MRPTLLAVALISLAVTLPAQAQTYKWKDAQGRTVISDTPQPGSGKQAPAIQTTEPTPAGEKTWADKDLEFRKRQQEKRESAEKASKEKTAADEKKSNCEQAKRNQTILESGERLATRNAQGEREFIDDQQRQVEIEKAKKSVKEWCQ